MRQLWLMEEISSLIPIICHCNCQVLIRGLFTSTVNSTLCLYNLFHWNILCCIICHWHLTEYLFFYDVYILPFVEQVLCVELPWKEENKNYVLLFNTNTILAVNIRVCLGNNIKYLCSIYHSYNMF